MLQAAATSNDGTSSRRAVRPLPGRLTRTRTKDVIIISDSDDDDFSDEVVELERPTKRQRIESSGLSDGLQQLTVSSRDTSGMVASSSQSKARTTSTDGSKRSDRGSYSGTVNSETQGPSKPSLESKEFQTEHGRESTAPAASGASQKVDPIDGLFAQLLEVVPDVDPDYARALLTQEYDTHGTGAMEVVFHSLFESTSYPKIDRKGKRKRETSASSSPVEEDLTQTEYGRKDRVYSGGAHYLTLALVSP